jgi:hypothetical protein
MQSSSQIRVKTYQLLIFSEQNLIICIEWTKEIALRDGGLVHPFVKQGRDI